MIYLSKRVKSIESEARSNAIKTLLNEVQINCHLICSICGKEIISNNHYNRSILPDCGGHEDGETDNHELVGIGDHKEAVLSNIEPAPAIALKVEELASLLADDDVWVLWPIVTSQNGLS